MKKDKICREFQEWLDHLPLGMPTEKMKQHLAACPECRKLFDSLAPLARALSEIPPPVKLSEDKIKSLTAAAKNEALRVTDRRTAWRLARNMLLGLPFIIVVHWLWLGLGSKALANFLTPLIAQIFSILIIAGSSLTAALVFGAVPLLWNSVRRNSSQELLR